MGASGDPHVGSGTVTLKLWKDGFTINDGEIRPYDDPENEAFLTAIKRGEIPKEIRKYVNDAELSLDMEDHRNEMYVPQKSKVKAFSWKGHMLGR